MALRHIDVLDKGYVRLQTYMPHDMVAIEDAIERGDLIEARKYVTDHDLTPVNAARASFQKKSLELSGDDLRLIHFLASHSHTSPFRHSTAQFEISAPLMVARQWWKHVIGSAHEEGVPDYGYCSLTAWNEGSRRYVIEEPSFYVPEPKAWRQAPAIRKQGSGGPLPTVVGEMLTADLIWYIECGEALYKEALAVGVAPEQARLFLPAYGMYIKWYWTASVQAVCHFLQQRLSHDAQAEITEYAKAVYALIKPRFPYSVHELLKDA